MTKIKAAMLLGALLISGTTSADLKTGLIAHWSFDDCTANDSSGNGNNGSIQGSPQCVDGVKSKALYFNGSSINISESIATGYFSFSGWFKTSSTKGGADNGNMIIRLRYYGYAIMVDSGKLTSGLNTSSSSGYGFTSEKNVADDLWHHVALAYDANGFNLYLDGALIIRQNSGNNLPLYFQRGGGYSLGKDGNHPSDYLNGALDDIRIYNRALSDTEIKALYQQNKTSSVVVGTNIWPVKKPKSGVQPYAVQCKNNTTKKTVTNKSHTSQTYNCEEMGVNIQSGDDVTVAIRAKVKSTDAGLSHQKVNGHVTWAAYPYYVECLNKTTSQRVTFSSNKQNYDCEDAGLSVSPLDIVRVQVRGTVDDAYSVGQKQLWNQLVSQAEIGDILFFNHEHDCSGDSCYFQTGVYVFGEAYGFHSHAALVVSKDMDTESIEVFQATSPYAPLSEQVSKGVLNLYGLHSSYPRGSIKLRRVNNTDLATKTAIVNAGIEKYEPYRYVSIKNVGEVLKGKSTYCSALVRDIYKDKGILLDDADHATGWFFTQFIFTPDELDNSTNLQLVAGMVF